MKKVIFRHSTSRQLLLSVAFLFTFTLSGFSQAQAAQDTTAQAEAGQEAAAADAGGSDLGDPAAGKELFNSLCAACHKPYSNSIGPALHGVTERREMEWLYQWIKNSCCYDRQW